MRKPDRVANAIAELGIDTNRPEPRTA